MNELFRNDSLIVTLDEETIEFSFYEEEPSDAHGATTAQAVRDLMDQLATEQDPDARFDVMVDLMPIKRLYPRTLAAYANNLFTHRRMIRRAAFATKNTLLRMAASTAFLLPGLTVKAFADKAAARAYLAGT